MSRRCKEIFVGGLCKRGEASLVNPRLNVPVSNAFEIDHSGSNVAMSHPLLQCADIDSVLQMSGGVGVTKFVKEPSAAVGSISTAIHLCRSVFQFMSRDTVPAVELCSKRDSFEFLEHCTIGLSRFARKHRVILPCRQRAKVC